MTRRVCKHENVQLWWRWYGAWIDHRPRLCNEPHDREICDDCGAWLPLGPSNETDPRVAVEIRAAHLAAEWKPIGGVRRIIKPDESAGWSGWPYRQPTNDGEWTGFLAAQIRNHEQDLGDVNWAGHHMADHEIGALIDRSSIGAGLRNIRENGVEAELAGRSTRGTEPKWRSPRMRSRMPSTPSRRRARLMTRLTDEHLDLLERALVAIENDYRPTCESVNYGSGCPGPTDATLEFWRRATDCTQAMITELRERRAADLDAEQMRLLSDVSDFIQEQIDGGADTCGEHRLQIEVLDKLLANGGKS